MCGGFDVDSREKEMRRLIERLPANAPPIRTGAVFPGQNALIIMGNGGNGVCDSLSWGFPRWDGKGVVFNARAETALEKPMFVKALKKNPGVVPCSGFFEWRKNPETGKKDRYLFRNPDSPLLYLAGFWNDFPDHARAFAILTTEANESMRFYHHRMPLLIQEQDIPGWLAGENLRDALKLTPMPVEARLAERI